MIEKFLCIECSTDLDKLFGHSVQRWHLWWHDVNTKFYNGLLLHTRITGVDGGVLYCACHDQVPFSVGNVPNILFFYWAVTLCLVHRYPSFGGTCFLLYLSWNGGGQFLWNSCTCLPHYLVLHSGGCGVHIDCRWKILPHSSSFLVCIKIYLDTSKAAG